MASGEYLWLPAGDPRPIEIDGNLILAGTRVELESGPHRVRIPEAETAGHLVLAMHDPPTPQSATFYRAY